MEESAAAVEESAGVESVASAGVEVDAGSAVEPVVEAVPSVACGRGEASSAAQPTSAPRRSNDRRVTSVRYGLDGRDTIAVVRMPAPQSVDVWKLADLCTPWCMHVVVTLRIPDLLAAGPRELEELRPA